MARRILLATLALTGVVLVAWAMIAPAWWHGQLGTSTSRLASVGLWEARACFVIGEKRCETLSLLATTKTLATQPWFGRLGAIALALSGLLALTSFVTAVAAMVRRQKLVGLGMLQLGLAVAASAATLAFVLLKPSRIALPMGWPPWLFGLGALVLAVASRQLWRAPAPISARVRASIPELSRDGLAWLAKRRVARHGKPTPLPGALPAPSATVLLPASSLSAPEALLPAPASPPSAPTMFQAAPRSTAGSDGERPLSLSDADLQDEEVSPIPRALPVEAKPPGAPPNKAHAPGLPPALQAMFEPREPRERTPLPPPPTGAGSAQVATLIAVAPPTRGILDGQGHRLPPVPAPLVPVAAPALAPLAPLAPPTGSPAAASLVPLPLAAATQAAPASVSPPVAPTLIAAAPSGGGLASTGPAAVHAAQPGTIVAGQGLPPAQPWSMGQGPLAPLRGGGGVPAPHGGLAPHAPLAPVVGDAAPKFPAPIKPGALPSLPIPSIRIGVPKTIPPPNAKADKPK